MWGVGFEVSDFGFRVSGLGCEFRVLRFGFRVSGFNFRVSVFGVRISGCMGQACIAHAKAKSSTDQIAAESVWFNVLFFDFFDLIFHWPILCFRSLRLMIQNSRFRVQDLGFRI